MARPLSRERLFDRSREFVAARAVSISGQDYSPGHPIDKDQLPTRRLRLLYEQRFIDMVGEDDLPHTLNGHIPTGSSLPPRTAQKTSGKRWVGLENGVVVTEPMSLVKVREWMNAAPGTVVT